MHEQQTRVSKEGWSIIGFTFFATLIFALLDWDFLAFIFLILSFFVLLFFRDPERIVSSKEGHALSPADGKVVYAGRSLDPLKKKECLKVSVFMNIFNVHVNRSPVQGKIKKISYQTGSFLSATKHRASKDNEQNLLEIEDNHGQSWYLIQIAGMLARRIVCWVEENDQVQRGEKLGIIKFGSRVDLYLPASYYLTIERGDKVLAGLSILAKSKK